MGAPNSDEFGKRSIYRLIPRPKAACLPGLGKESLIDPDTSWHGRILAHGAFRDQPFLSAFICSLKSAGSGALKSRTFPVFGWRSDRRAEWSITRPGWRFILMFSFQPYAESPRSGWPSEAMCTRIWWVRPVWSVHVTSAARSP